MKNFLPGFSKTIPDNESEEMIVAVNAIHLFIFLQLIYDLFHISLTLIPVKSPSAAAVISLSCYRASRS